MGPGGARNEGFANTGSLRSRSCTHYPYHGTPASSISRRSKKQPESLAPQSHDNSEAVHLSEALEASSQVLANSEAALPRDRAAAALGRYNAQAGRLDLLQEALAEAQKSDELLAEQNRHILAEMARLEKQVGLMQAERERLYGEASLVAEAEQKLREDLESRDRDLSGKEAHVRQLEAEINRIMSSRSIRLTAPLRRLGGFLRR